MKRIAVIGLVSVLAIMLISHTPLKSSDSTRRVKRYGSVIGLKAEQVEEYKKLHAECWPDVRKMITECNIRNISIFLRKLDDGKYYLFNYFEYCGDDYAADMAKMAADPVTQKWWQHCEPCQIPLADRKTGEWWAPMEEVFHQD